MNFETETYASIFLDTFKDEMNEPDLTIGDLHAVFREAEIIPIVRDKKGHELYPTPQVLKLLRDKQKFNRCYRIVKEKRGETCYDDNWDCVPSGGEIPELCDMQNASDELLRQQEVYYEMIESKINAYKNRKVKTLEESVIEQYMLNGLGIANESKNTGKEQKDKLQQFYEKHGEHWVKTHKLDGVLKAFETDKTTSGMILVDVFEVKPDQYSDGCYIAKFYGGLNGSGKWETYLNDIKEIITNFKDSYIVDLDVDVADDVWTLYVGIRKDDKKINESEMLIYSHITEPVLYSTFRYVDGSTPSLSCYEFGYLAQYQEIDHDFLMVTKGEGYPCVFAKSVIPLCRFKVKKTELNSTTGTRVGEYSYSVDDTYELVNVLRPCCSESKITINDLKTCIETIDKKHTETPITESIKPLLEGIGGYKPSDSDEFQDTCAREAEVFIDNIIAHLEKLNTRTNTRNEYHRYIYMGIINDFLRTALLSHRSLFWKDDDKPIKINRGIRLINAFNNAYEFVKGKGSYMGWKDPVEFDKEVEHTKKIFDSLMAERKMDGTTEKFMDKLRVLNRKRDILFYE